MTVRLTAEQAEDLDIVADVDNQPISQVIPVAIQHRIEARKQDAEFQDGSPNASSTRNECSRRTRCSIQTADRGRRACSGSFTALVREEPSSAHRTATSLLSALAPHRALSYVRTQPSGDDLNVRPSQHHRLRDVITSVNGEMVTGCLPRKRDS